MGTSHLYKLVSLMTYNLFVYIRSATVKFFFVIYFILYKIKVWTILKY